MPKLSIIIPVYNVEKYIDCCLKSVINQTIKDIEIILVDDGSKDNSSIICDKYSLMDNRIKVIHKVNQGLGYARNSGIEIATGEYVTFLDSDDFVDLVTYERICKLISKYSLDALYFKYERFSNEDEVGITKINDEIQIYSGENVNNLMLDIIASKPSSKRDHEIECSSCTAVYRLDVINEKNIRFKSERKLISEDLIFNLDYLCNVSKVAINNTCYYHYRYNDSSLTKTVRTDRIEMNMMLYKYINDNSKSWGLLCDKMFERNDRLFIGNSRSAIVQYVNSSVSNAEKILWLKDILSNSIWCEIYIQNNWKSLPLFQKIFFKLCYLNMPRLIILLCKLRSIAFRLIN